MWAKQKRQPGFTIVELLIVIVIIGILAAITIVAYNGIQTRARTSSAQSAANNVAKKAELYNTEVGNYPTTFGDLTGAAATATYKLTGIASAGTLSNTTPNNSIHYAPCGKGSPVNLAAITTSNVVGARIYYRDYGNSGNTLVPVGAQSGADVACFNSLGAAV